MNQCNDPTDVFATVTYYRSWPILLNSGIMPIANLKSFVMGLAGSYATVYIHTSGPNGGTNYTGDGYQDYLNNGGAPVLPAPVGHIDNLGYTDCFAPPDLSGRPALGPRSIHVRR